MGVLVVAGGHAPPVLEPANAALHGIARRVPFRVMTDAANPAPAPVKVWQLRAKR